MTEEKCNKEAKRLFKGLIAAEASLEDVIEVLTEQLKKTKEEIKALEIESEKIKKIHAKYKDNQDDYPHDEAEKAIKVFQRSYSCHLFYNIVAQALIEAKDAMIKKLKKQCESSIENFIRMPVVGNMTTC